MKMGFSNLSKLASACLSWVARATLLSGSSKATGSVSAPYPEKINRFLRAARVRATRSPDHPNALVLAPGFFATTRDRLPVMIAAMAIGFLVYPADKALAQSVLPNGDFEQADPAHPDKPAHWDAMDGQGVQWADAPNVPGSPPHGKAIRMNTALTEVQMDASYTKAGLKQWIVPHPAGSTIAESYGLSLYSDAVPIVPGKTYRVSFDYMSEKRTAGKLWFRAYADVNGQKKRAYEGTVDCDSKGAWKTFTGVFHPTKYRSNVTEFKIMLFAYYPAGVAWFDNIKLEAIDEAN